MPIFAFALSILLMLAFLAWGIYTLRERYVRHEDLPQHIEVATLIGVVIFLALELVLIRVWMGSIEVFYAFTALALLAASTALYGPTFVSVVSRIVVDMLHPPNEQHAEEPHFGPAEALEGEGDYEGALREYMVIARVFPKDAEAAFRVAGVLCELERFEEAADSFTRGLTLCAEPERALLATNRLADVYQHQLGRTDKAAETLEGYLEKFPQVARAELVRRKLDRLTAKTAPAEGNGSAV